MKKSTISIILFISALLPAAAGAQDIPEPLLEPQESMQETSASDTDTPETAPETDGSDATEQNTGSVTAAESPESILARQLIAFFTGLDDAVTAKQGDCEAMANAVRDYYDSQKNWIDSLDYSTVSIDSQTINTIHEKSIDFGKKLSSCYDQKSIPAMLRMYAGLGEEF